MKRVFISILAIVSFNTWADVTVQVLDQNKKPVPDTVISLPSYPVKTPNGIAIMDQIHTQFSPHVLVIQKDQSVSFPNSDDIRHQVYSFSAPKVFEIKLYKGISTAPILFDKPGLVVLGCNIHDNMIGYIYVADNEFTAITDKDGKVSLPAKAGDRINIWNEYLASTVNMKKSLVLKDDQFETIVLDLLPAHAEEKAIDDVNPGFNKKF